MAVLADLQGKPELPGLFKTLLTFHREPGEMIVDLEALDGTILDRTRYSGRSWPKEKVLHRQMQGLCRFGYCAFPNAVVTIVAAKLTAGGVCDFIAGR